MGTGDIKAENTLFYRYTFTPTNEDYWSISAYTGEEEDYFSFAMQVNYVDENILEGVYTQADKLNFSRSYAIAVGVIQTVTADSATLKIRIDPVKGTAEGEFEALFKTRRLQPKGTFTLQRDNLKHRHNSKVA